MKNRPEDRPGFGNTGTSTGGNTGTSFQAGQNQGGSDSGGVGTMTEKARDMATGVADKARDMAGNVADRARDIAGNVGDTFTGAPASVGSGIKSLAETIREHTPDSGMLRGAGNTVADTLESGARYLEHGSWSGIGNDLTNIVRRNPIPALFAGVAIGFLLARATTSNRS